MLTFCIRAASGSTSPTKTKAVDTGAQLTVVYTSLSENASRVKVTLMDVELKPEVGFVVDGYFYLKRLSIGIAFDLSQPVTLMKLAELIEYAPATNRDSELPSDEQLTQAESPLSVVAVSAAPLFAKPTIMEVRCAFFDQTCFCFTALDVDVVASQVSLNFMTVQAYVCESFFRHATPAMAVSFIGNTQMTLAGYGGPYPGTRPDIRLHPASFSDVGKVFRGFGFNRSLTEVEAYVESLIVSYVGAMHYQEPVVLSTPMAISVKSSSSFTTCISSFSRTSRSWSESRLSLPDTATLTVSYGTLVRGLRVLQGFMSRMDDGEEEASKRDAAVVAPRSERTRHPDDYELIVDRSVLSQLSFRPTPSGYYLLDSSRAHDDGLGCFEASTHALCDPVNADLILAVNGLPTNQMSQVDIDSLKSAGKDATLTMRCLGSSLSISSPSGVHFVLTNDQTPLLLVKASQIVGERQWTSSAADRHRPAVLASFMTGFTTVEIDVFNAVNSEWEPFVEPWSPVVRMSQVDFSEDVAAGRAERMFSLGGDADEGVQGLK